MASSSTTTTITGPAPAALIDQCLPPSAGGGGVGGGGGGGDGHPGGDESPSSRVLLFFGASWCAACRAQEMKSILGADFGIGLQATIYVSCDIDEEATTAFQVAYPSWSLAPGEVRADLLRVYEVGSLPHVEVVRRGDGTRVEESEWVVGLGPAARGLRDLCMARREGGGVVEGGGREAAGVLMRKGLEFSDAGEFSRALEAFSDALAVDPGYSSAHFNMGALLQMLGQARLAVGHMVEVVAARPDDAIAHSVLGTVLYEAEPGAVVQAYRSLVRRHPGNARAAHQLACLTGEGESAVTAAPAYVKEVFDELASTFEEKLVNHLHYRVPWQMFDAVQSQHPLESCAGDWQVLDLGCGTGLCGKIFRPYTTQGGRMVGVDLSPKMVELARQTGAYDQVMVEDIHDSLLGSTTTTTTLDLVLSGDCFIYVGVLDRCFSLTAAALRPGGLFSFSIELLKEETAPPAGYVLQRSGRYAHTEAYITRLGREHGLFEVDKTCVTVRMEQSIPIPGLVYVLRKQEDEKGV